MGKGSQTEISQTSRVLSGCALDSALSLLIMSDSMRMGDEEAGDDWTRTRRAEGVSGARSTSASKSRYFRDRFMVYMALPTEDAMRNHTSEPTCSS